MNKVNTNNYYFYVSIILILFIKISIKTNWNKAYAFYTVKFTAFVMHLVSYTTYFKYQIVIFFNLNINLHRRKELNFSKVS